MPAAPRESHNSVINPRIVQKTLNLPVGRRIRHRHSCLLHHGSPEELIDDGIPLFSVLVEVLR